MIASRRRTLTASFAARTSRTTSANASEVASRSATRASERGGVEVGFCLRRDGECQGALLVPQTLLQFH